MRPTVRGHRNTLPLRERASSPPLGPLLPRPVLPSIPSDVRDVGGMTGRSVYVPVSLLLDVEPGARIVVGNRSGAATLRRCTDATCSETMLGGSLAGQRAIAARFDAATNQVFVLTTKPALHACAPDGTSCVPSNLPGTKAWRLGNAIIDPVEQKILVRGRDTLIVRCGPDGSPCSGPVSPWPNDLGFWSPSFTLDEDNQRLVTSVAEGKTVRVSRCKLDGSQCTTHGRRPVLLTCATDGTGCTEKDIAAGEPDESGATPAVFWSASNQRVLAVTSHAARFRRPVLFSASP